MSDVTSTSLHPQYIGAMSQPVILQVVRSIEPIVQQAGLELIGVERAQEGRRLTLWIYLDHPDGITLDQCSEVSPEISAVLDVIDPIADKYDLRVSSPGIDRPLMSDKDFTRFIGCSVHIKLMSPLKGRRKFIGQIVEMNTDLQIRCVDGEHYIPLSLIHRARLHYTDEEIQKLLRSKSK